MSVFLAILITIAVLIRLYYIVKIMCTYDFWISLIPVGLFLGTFQIFLGEIRYVSFHEIIVSIILIAMSILAMSHLFSKRRLDISNIGLFGSTVMMYIFLVINFLGVMLVRGHHFESSFKILLIFLLIGTILMFFCKRFRIPWHILGTLATLGLIIAAATSNNNSNVDNGGSVFIDTSSMAPPIDTSTFQPIAPSTFQPIDSSTLTTVSTMASIVSTTTPIDNSSIMDINNQLSGINDAAIYDSNGFRQEHIAQTGNNSFVIQDNMNQTIGTATTDPITGDMNINMNDGTSSSITAGGTIQNNMGLNDGRIITQDNGDKIILNAQNQVIETIKADGTILNSMNMTTGKIK